MFTDLLVPKGPRAQASAARPSWFNFCSNTLMLIVLSLIALPAAPAQAASIYWTGFTGSMGRANLDGTGVKNLNVNAWGVALDVAAGKMYTTPGFGPGARQIDRYTLNGTYEKTFSTASISATDSYGLAFDTSAGKFYWGNDNGIASAKFGPLGNALIEQTQIVQSPSERVLSLGLDLTGGKIYYTTEDEIRRANLDGTDQQTIATGLQGAVALALDLSGGKVYWSDTVIGGSEIVRANLDGTDQEVIVPPSPAVIGVIPGIGLDVAAGKMYWSYNASIMRANLDGSGSEVFLPYSNIALNFAFDFTPVPEPSSFVLSAVGLIGLVVWRRRKRRPKSLDLS